MISQAQTLQPSYSRHIHEERVPTLVRFFAYLFFISLPFNQFTVKILTPTDNITKYTGFLLIIVFFLAYRFHFGFYTKSSKWFLIYFIYTSALELIRYMYIDPFYERSLLSAAFQHVQVAGLFFVFANITRDKKVVYRIFDLFIIINLIKAIILTFNIRMFMTGFERETGRFGILGENLNQTAILLSVTFVIILARTLNRRKFDIQVFLYFLSMALIVFSIVKTGSRGGVVVLTTGTLLTLIKHFNTQNLFRNILLIITIVYFTITFLSETPLYQRMLSAIQLKETGYRWELVTASFELLKTNYWLGYGSHYPEILGNYLGKTRIQAHNTYLQLILSFGIIGFLLFMVSFALSFRDLYRNQYNLIGSSSLIIFVSFLISFASTGLAVNKTLWVFIAIFSNIAIWNYSKESVPKVKEVEPIESSALEAGKQYA
ncbi:MAG: O-antigen ligase family protein [bacterium]|nr:O-antigen ligase family protein [bacterium]